MIDLHKGILRKGFARDCSLRELQLSQRKEDLDRVLGLDILTAALIEPVDDTGADSDNDAETNTTENEIYFCKMRLPELWEFQGYKSDLKTILTFVQ